MSNFYLGLYNFEDAHYKIKPNKYILENTLNINIL